MKQPDWKYWKYAEHAQLGTIDKENIFEYVGIYCNPIPG